MKSIYLSIVFCLIYIGLNAQNKGEIYIIDSIKLQCTYEQKVIVYNPETKQEKQEIHNIALQIGHKISKYFDTKDIIVDSIILEYENIDHDRHAVATLMMPHMAGRMKDKLYKNHSENKITTRTSLLGAYTYDEPYDSPKWVLHNNTKTIVGYPCKKATTTFRGREYEVWYTTRIPISDGPWKFKGLPGLILSAKDSKGEVFFDIQSITKPKETKYIYKNKDGHTCIHLKSKKEFADMYKKYMESPGAFVGGTGLVESQLPPIAYKRRYYNPIELSE